MIPFLRRSICLVGLALATNTFAGLAAAQSVTDAQSALAYFNRLDQQKQGSFTLADMQRIEGKEFKRIDVDHDGKLTLAEYVYGIPADRPDELRRYTRRFQLSDKNQDGFVSYDEYMEFCARVVTLADTNKDGVVTKEEFMAITNGGGQ
jgi:hypothetical protein